MLNEQHKSVEEMLLAKYIAEEEEEAGGGTATLRKCIFFTDIAIYSTSSLIYSANSNDNCALLLLCFFATH